MITAYEVSKNPGAVQSAPLRDAVTGCGRLLIEFVYDTIERSRRRSLREMWLAARESGSDPNQEFRQRILDYLTQGDVTPVLESLVDRSRFSYDDWIAELRQVTTSDEARELRGSSARLLPSYPDHPGLLLARGLSEAVGSLTRFSGQCTCRHHAASAAAAGLLSYSTGLMSPIEG